MERGGARLHEEEMEAMMALEMKVVRAPCLREGGRKGGKACGEDRSYAVWQLTRRRRE